MTHPKTPAQLILEQRFQDAALRRTRKSGPIAVGLAQTIRQAIADGELQVGTRLPTERALSLATGVSRRTVTAAYDIVRREGHLVSRQGSGTWVREAGPETLDTARLPDVFGEPNHAIPFTMAKLSALPMVQDAILGLRRAEVADLLAGKGYETFGLTGLRREIAAHYTRWGLPTGEDQILVTTGVQQAISLIAGLLLSRDSRVVIEDPSYSGAIDAFRWSGAEILPITYRPGGVDLDELRDLIRESRPDLLYVMSVHNPTGLFMREEVRRGIVAICHEFGVPILEDLALSQITLGGKSPRPLSMLTGEDPPVYAVDSASKILWGGLRVGWIRAPRAIIQKLGRLKVVADLGSPLMSQFVTARLLPRLPEASDFVRGIIAPRLDQMIQLLSTHLPDWRWQVPQGGFSLWVQMPLEAATQFVPLAERHGVSIVAGPSLSSRGGFEDHVRLPFVLSEAATQEGVRRLADAWAIHLQVSTRRLASNVVV